MAVPDTHFASGHRLQPPFPAGHERAMFGMGCFWGAERKFSQLPGVYSTAVGYAAGHTPNSTYREVCSGMTGHTQAVLVVFDAKAMTMTIGNIAWAYVVGSYVVLWYPTWRRAGSLLNLP